MAPASRRAACASRAMTCSRRSGRPDFPLKIAALADLHACEPWMDLERIAEIVAQTNALGADLIVLLGDYVDRHAAGDAAHSGRRMGAGARRAEGAARRARGARQSRLVGRPDRAAGRRRACRCPARTRGRRHSGLRERRGAAEQIRPAVLARRPRRSARLSFRRAAFARSTASASTILPRRLRR